MYRSKITALIPLALALTGCAHRTLAPEAAPEAHDGEEGQPTATVTLPPTVPQALPRIAPDKDPRYSLPQAETRALTIFLSSQTFEYVEDDRVVASGQVSTGTREHPTPPGSFRVVSKDENKRSGKYTNYFNDNTPMPYSLQFYGPYFIHEGWVPGYADSHGCVRLHYEDARLIFSRIKIGDPIHVKMEGAARPSNPWPAPFPVF
jgi:lipoprotein-anchoring transpeptidase ErfK/SrfK